MGSAQQPDLLSGIRTQGAKPQGFSSIQRIKQKVGGAVKNILHNKYAKYGLSLAVGLLLQQQGGIIDKQMGTSGTHLGPTPSSYNIKVNGKPSQEYISYTNNEYMEHYPELIISLDKYAKKQNTLTLMGPGSSAEKDLGASLHNTMRKSIIKNSANTDTLPNGMENIPGLNHQAVCLGSGKQALLAKYGYGSRTPKTMQDFFLKKGLGTRNTPPILDRLGWESFGNDPLKRMATGDGDIAFALFHGSSHIHDHGAQENGTHTITPIGIATHTYTNEELAINSESTDAEIIAAYCVRYPTFVKSIHQGGSRRIEDLGACTKQAQYILKTYPNIVSITRTASSVSISGPFIQHGITVKDYKGNRENIRHTETLASFVSRATPSSVFFDLKKCYNINPNATTNTNQVSGLDKDMIIGGRNMEDNQLRQNRGQSMITLEHVVDNLIEKENKLYPDLIYPDIKTRKKRTALGMKYLGIYHTQVAYRIYPQLSTSSKYQAFYEGLEQRREAQAQGYNTQTKNASYLQEFESLEKFLDTYQIIKYPIAQGRNKESTLRDIISGLHAFLSEREPGLQYYKPNETGNEILRADIIKQLETKGIISYSNPSPKKQFQEGKYFSIHIPQLLERLLTQSEQAYLKGYSNQLLVSDALPDFYQHAISRLIPEPSFQAILRKIKERESPGERRDISSLRKLSKVAAEERESLGGESTRNIVHTEGEFQLDTKILSEVSRDNYYRRANVIQMLEDGKTNKLLQDEEIEPSDYEPRLRKLKDNVEAIYKLLKIQDKLKSNASGIISPTFETFIKSSFNLEYLLSPSDKYKKVAEILYVYTKCKQEYDDLLAFTNSNGKPVMHTFTDQSTTTYTPNKFVLSSKTSAESIAGLQEVIVHMHNSGFPKMCYYLYANYITNIIEKAQESEQTQLLTPEQYKSLSQKSFDERRTQSL